MTASRSTDASRRRDNTPSASLVDWHGRPFLVRLQVQRGLPIGPFRLAPRADLNTEPDL